MIKLPKFAARSRGPLRPEEHEACKTALGAVFGQMESAIDGTGHVLHGRLQKYRGKDCPCVYVFYSEERFADEQRGLMYFMQDLKDGGFEIVFRKWKRQPPIPGDQWTALAHPDKDDRYNVCSANKWRWCAFQIRTPEEATRAKSLLAIAKDTFERIFEIVKTSTPPKS